MSIDLILGDCREVMPQRGPFDMIVADPPYGETTLDWDRRVNGWLDVAGAALKSSGSLWVFGSLRYFLELAPHLAASKLRIAQEIVWEKQNGSGLHNDRFKRVHELVVQLYLKDAPWKGVWNCVQTTADATARTIRRTRRPAHWGAIDAGHYESEDGGPRIMRSVVYCRNQHGRAIHPTEKPVALLETLIKTSCPPGGTVGDFFAGSAACGEAARMCRRNYVGVEIDAAYHERASARLQGQLPLEQMSAEAEVAAGQ